MRELIGRGESVWISAEPRAWFDISIERMLSKSLAAEPSAAVSPLYARHRNIKIWLMSRTSANVKVYAVVVQKISQFALRVNKSPDF